MHRLIIILVATWIAGCSQQPPRSENPANETSDATVPEAVAEGTADWTTFSKRWASASHADRRSMANVMEIGEAFQGATKGRVNEVFGEADQSGMDDFGEDVLRYELGEMPGSDGTAQYHLTFVFDQDVVVRVMGNFISEQ